MMGTHEALDSNVVIPTMQDMLLMVILESRELPSKNRNREIEALEVIPSVTGIRRKLLQERTT